MYGWVTLIVFVKMSYHYVISLLKRQINMLRLSVIEYIHIVIMRSQ
jgi:hypothetical protein